MAHSSRSQEILGVRLWTKPKLGAKQRYRLQNFDRVGLPESVG